MVSLKKENQMHRCPDLQMSLPLPYDGWSENALREAHKAAHIRMSFDEAMRDRALEICLRCFAEARLRRLGKMTLPSSDSQH
jgi:hypothetical protein